MFGGQISGNGGHVDVVVAEREVEVVKGGIELVVDGIVDGIMVDGRVVRSG